MGACFSLDDLVQSQHNDSYIGLYFYNARYYDPYLNRFIQADSIVPGAASGAGGGAATLGYASNTRLTPLTVNLGEFAAQVNAENREVLQFGAFFQWSSKTRQEHNVPMGPANPQALNRYAYCLNNPLRYVDPTGHIALSENTFSIEQLGRLQQLIIDTKFSAELAGIVGAGAALVLGWLSGVGAGIGVLTASVWGAEAVFEAWQLDRLADHIGQIIEAATTNGLDTVTLRTSYDPFFSMEGDWWTGIGTTLSAVDAQGQEIIPGLVLTGMTGLILPLVIQEPASLANALHKVRATSIVWE